MKVCAICNEQEENCFHGGMIRVNGKVYDLCFACESNWKNFNEIVKSQATDSASLSLYEDVRGYLSTTLLHNPVVPAPVQAFVGSAILAADTAAMQREEKRQQAEAFTRQYNSLLLTTGYDFQGYQINRYIQVISGETVLGTGIFSELSVSAADIFGVQSNLFAEKLVEAKTIAQGKLMQKACQCGANAIIGVDFDYITLYNNILGVVANGTAVCIEKTAAVK